MFVAYMLYNMFAKNNNNLINNALNNNQFTGPEVII